MHRNLLTSLVPALMLLLAPLAHANDMIHSSQIGNDPAKAKLCASRTKLGKPVPFMISANYLNVARDFHPDVTFIAVKMHGGGGQLVACYLREGTGRYEPASYTPENDDWQLAGKPQRHDPDIRSDAGKQVASKICQNAALSKMSRAGYSHSVTTRVVELQDAGKAAGKKSQPYDVVVEGQSFFQSRGPDLKAKNYSCLLSSMFDVKGVQIKG